MDIQLSSHALDILASVVSSLQEKPLLSKNRARNSLEHRVSCHRCGNIRKRKMLCVSLDCPHIYCGRCADKMIDEYGRNIFDGGCPVCLELCCCHNKSVFCNRKNHCYRKCPATKPKSRIKDTNDDNDNDVNDRASKHNNDDEENNDDDESIRKSSTYKSNNLFTKSKIILNSQDETTKPNFKNNLPLFSASQNLLSGNSFQDTSTLLHQNFMFPMEFNSTSTSSILPNSTSSPLYLSSMSNKTSTSQFNITPGSASFTPMIGSTSTYSMPISTSDDAISTSISTIRFPVTSTFNTVLMNSSAVSLQVSSPPFPMLSSSSRLPSNNDVLSEQHATITITPLLSPSPLSSSSLSSQHMIAMKQEESPIIIWPPNNLRTNNITVVPTTSNSIKSPEKALLPQLLPPDNSSSSSNNISSSSSRSVSIATVVPD